MSGLIQVANGFLFVSGGIVAAIVFRILFHASLCAG